MLRSIFILAMNCIQKREVNWGSLSETIEVGKPWTEKIRSMRRLAVLTAVMFWETGMRYVNPLKRSNTTRISFFLLLLGVTILSLRVILAAGNR